jgi:hypothetical protein
MDSLNRRLMHGMAWAVILAVLGIAGCQLLAPQNGWNKKKWGPLVPHTKFPGDCSICHQPEGWDKLREDFVFDHEKETGYLLEGAHSQAACLRCHNDRGPVDAYVTRGCSGCHLDPHASSLGMDCGQCHSQISWEPTGLVGEHARTRFPLMGAHAIATCESCHPGAAAGQFRGAPLQCEICHQADLAQANNPDHLSNGWNTDCQKCHQPSGWSGAFIDHSFFPLSGGHGGLDCAQCHIGETFSGLSQDCFSCHSADFQSAPGHVSNNYSRDCTQCHDINEWDSVRIDHSFFPLTGRHGGLSCSECHAPGTFSGLSQDCFSCHSEQFQSAEGHVSGNYSHDCTQCHSGNNWESARVDHSFFPLTGEHAALSCTECHIGGSFSGLSQSCDSCHGKDFDIAPDHVAASFPLSCEQCHGTGTWSPAILDHSAFALAGGHGGLACAQCHAGGVFAGLSQDCYSCHTANYQSAPGHLANNFPQDCTQCHSSSAWQPAAFDHSFFPLTGGHTALDCAQCHAGGVYTGLSQDCYSCHTANYQSAPGHLANNFPQDCTQCHTVSAWTPASFDHSFFPLTGGHTALDCAQCHAGGVYAGLSQDCYSCHTPDYQSAPGHLANNFPHDCTQCHAVSGWTPATFDHSFFPLTGGHTALDCAQCHAGGVYAGLSTDCYSCHTAGFQGAPNHATLGFSHDCAQCHSIAGWTPSSFQHNFPLTGNHNTSCVTCHDGGSTQIFTCFNCHEHSQSNMNDKHSGVRNYSYNSLSCYNCHPNGRH